MDDTPNELLRRVTTNPEVRFGKPTIRGSRFAVVDLFEYLAGGMTEAEILEDFPDLEHDDFLACYLWAANLERHHLDKTA